MLFKIGNHIIDNVDFLQEIGTLYHLLIGLHIKELSLLKAEKEQNEMIKRARKFCLIGRRKY